MGWDLIIKFVILTFIVSGGIIFVLYRVFVTTVDGAKQRLEREADAARAREAELNKKIKEADEELQKRKQELDVLEKKMRIELEEAANKQKEELIQKARKEAEEIISKAQNARDSIRKEIEKTMEFKIIDYSARVLNDVLTDKAKSTFDQQLVVEFIEKLKSVDMCRIATDIPSADMTTARAVDPQVQTQLGQVVSEKLNRKVQINSMVDPKLIGGVALQFGSLLLDGSLQNFIREAAVVCKQEIDKK